MPLPLQGSLFDGRDDPELAPLTGIRRAPLSATAWIDLLPGWLSGADSLFAALSESVQWRAESRRMYDGVVAVPRLLAFFAEGAALPHPVLAEARTALSRHYRTAFATAGLCYYRDGRDSVAWHGDRIGRGASEDTLVAILSVGASRTLALRPRDGGAPTVRHPQGHGDLLVMGGDCQRAWDHAVPKTAKPVGPRISIQFRPSGVR
jgi:alkylated DNA repair dioxygenase AlkB